VPDNYFDIDVTKSHKKNTLIPIYKKNTILFQGGEPFTERGHNAKASLLSIESYEEKIKLGKSPSIAEVL